MKNKISLILVCFFCLLSNFILNAQTKTNHEQLKKNARLAESQFKKTQIEVKKKAKQRNLQLKGYDQKGKYFWLHHFDGNDNPVYYGTRNNSASASTIRASRLWNNGGAGFNLEGQGMEVSTTRARLGMWEPGVARLTHVEFGGRLTMRDGTTFSGDNGDNKHATHVAGTMMASGVNAIAKGMSPQAKMDGYDANNDLAEMNTAGNEGMLLSNHSYGQNLPAAGQAQDIARGRYDDEAKSWDDLCVAAPFYLPVQACGNDRDDASPNMTYDLLLGSSTAKNTLGIGACQVLTSPYSQPSDVVIGSFSSYGPTDDGRIKPDLVAPGVAITSSISSGDNNYEAQDGTSMAGPAAAAALFLVQQHYKNLNNGTFMRAATLRGLAIHTAEEAGTTAGPDYGFGWGLLNVEKCVQVVSNTSQTHLLTQESLNNNATFTRQITVAGGQPLKVTICWADLGATPLAENAANINNRTSRLVNDLDVRILDANNNVIADLPWKLNPDSPTAAATKADNLVDNIERIDVASLAAGTYTIRVTHKGTLANAQAFSLIVTGITTPSVAPTITSFTPTSGTVSTSVTITGTNFTGATVVSFNNVNATTFNVVSATSITATVPTSATTGKVRVTT
ncbi:MAG: peptidase S8, partial [Cytophagia bacterium]